ncbi:MAG TPA: G8 domain-containing protein, partial [Dehalococcoidia bacterium]|nr:G8 domain-containing protein [Dehalococcoidia bacterium]
MKFTRVRTALFLVLTLAVLMGMASRGHDAQPLEAAGDPDVSSVKSGVWSDPTLWSSGQVPTSGKSVAINSGHTVEYDVLSDQVLDEVSIQGTLRFSRKTSTRLET